MSEEEKLKYFQTKLHESLLEVINSYSLLQKKIQLIQPTLSLVFMDFRDSVLRSVHMPSRYKSSQSVISNFIKELTRNYFSKDCITSLNSKEEIDNYFEKVLTSVSKDFFGATFVLHSQNDVKNYCESLSNSTDDDKYIKKLYQQYLTVENYLNTPTISEEIDISKTFVDGDIVPNAPKSLSPLDLKNINTPEDYYNQLIPLLTLLTNCSMPRSEAPEKEGESSSFYSVAQTDIPYFKLVEEARTYNPKNKNEWIKILTKLARDTYFVPYKPFDVQLSEAINAMEKSKISSDYRESFKNETDRIHYTNQLYHLKDNLIDISKDRLLNAILKKELPVILDHLSDYPNLDVDVVSSKERSKANGFYSNYHVLKINNILYIELLSSSEFRNNLANEGPAAHNSMPGKSFDIRHLFELNDNYTHPFDSEQLDFYCNFLETVNLDDIYAYKNKLSKSNTRDIENLKILKDLVEYASSNLKVKDVIDENNCEMTFFNYIKSIISSYGAKFNSTVPAHRIEHNQALVVPQNATFSLENILKNRVGLSVLATLVRNKYREEAAKRGIELIPDDPARVYSPQTTAQIDLVRINSKLKEDINEYNEKYSLNTPFFPMGQSPKHNDPSGNEKNESNNRESEKKEKEYYDEKER